MVSRSLAGVEWFRTATYKSLLVALAMGFTGPLTIDNMKSGLETPKLNSKTASLLPFNG